MEQVKKLKKAPMYRFVIFIQILLCYILFYGGIQLIATLGPQLMEDLQIGEAQLGVFSALNNPTFAIASFIAGMLVGKFRGKKVMISGLLLLAVAGALYLSHPTNMVILCGIRLIQGFAMGLVITVVLSMANVWFPQKERGLSQGLLGSFYGASTSVVTVYCAQMSLRNMSWSQTAGYMLLVGGLVLAVIIFFGFKDIETVYGVHIIDEAIEGYEAVEEKVVEIENDPRPNTLQECLKYPGFWFNGIGLFFYCGSCFGTGFCLPLFLSHVGYDVGGSAAIMTYGSLGTIFFCLLGGFLSDRVFKAKRTPVYMIAFAFACVFTIIMAMVGHTATTVMVVLYFIMIGFCNFAAGPAWNIPSEVVGPNMAQQNMGISLLFSNAGGTIMLIIYGAVAQNYGGTAVMYVLAGCMAIAFICAVLLNRKCKL